MSPTMSDMLLVTFAWLLIVAGLAGGILAVAKLLRDDKKDDK